MEPARAASTTRTFDLDAGDWGRYLGALGGDGETLLARIALVSARGPGEDALVGLPLCAIRYHADADEIEVHVGRAAPCGLRYFVCAPRAIRVEEREGERTLTIEDARGLRTLIRFQLGAPAPRR